MVRMLKKQSRFCKTLSMLLAALLLAVPAGMQAFAQGEEKEPCALLNAYTGSFGAWNADAGDWSSDAMSYSGPHEVDADGTVAQALTTGADSSFMVAALVQTEKIDMVELAGAMAASFKVQYRADSGTNPTSFSGIWDYSGVGGFENNDITGFTQNTENGVTTLKFAQPVSAKALLFQGNGFNITNVKIYKAQEQQGGGEGGGEEGGGEETEVFTIRTADDLTAFAGMGDFQGKKVVLAANIDMTGKTWEPAAFKGTFDGQGYAITGLNVTGDNKGMLFTTLTDAVVMNLTISGSLTGGNVAGGFCRSLLGNSVIVNCMNQGKLQSGTRAAGIADEVANTAKIINTVFAGSIQCSGGEWDYEGGYGIGGWPVDGQSMNNLYYCYSTYNPLSNDRGDFGKPQFSAFKTADQMADAAFAAELNGNRAAAADLVDGMEEADLKEWKAVKDGFPTMDPDYVPSENPNQGGTENNPSTPPDGDNNYKTGDSWNLALIWIFLLSGGAVLLTAVRRRQK